MGECRNCGSTSTLDLGFIGDIAPFFLKRVLNLEQGFVPTPRPLKRALRRIPFLRSSFERLYRPAVRTEIQICEHCSFIQTKFPFPDEALARLYADYRSDSYNRERVRYEPEYAAIVSQVGSGEQEFRSRTEGLTRWLQSRITTSPEFSMLDYGGADGRFLPSLPGRKYVYEISSIPPAPGVTRIENDALSASYSYVQLAHVLEHVSWPLALTRKAAACLQPSGHLYIEVPQELTDEQTARLAKGDRNIPLLIHEHINKCNVKSVTRLLEAAGLEIVAVQSEMADFGWARAAIVRALARKH